MKINPISISFFSIKNNNQKNLNVTNPVKTFDSFDSFSLSFGKKEKPITDKQEYNFKKEYKEIKKLIDARDDFTPQDKKYLKWAIKYDHDAMKRNFLRDKSDSMRNANSVQLFTVFVSWFGREDKLKWEKAEQEFEAKSKQYTDEIKKLLPNKRASRDLIENFHRIDDKYKELGWTLFENEKFPVERIISFASILVPYYRCDQDKLKQMVAQGETSVMKLINETKTKLFI